MYLPHDPEYGHHTHYQYPVRAQLAFTRGVQTSEITRTGTGEYELVRRFMGSRGLISSDTLHYQQFTESTATAQTVGAMNGPLTCQKSEPAIENYVNECRSFAVQFATSMDWDSRRLVHRSDTKPATREQGNDDPNEPERDEDDTTTGTGISRGPVLSQTIREEIWDAFHELTAIATTDGTLNEPYLPHRPLQSVVITGELIRALRQNNQCEWSDRQKKWMQQNTRTAMGLIRALELFTETRPVSWYVQQSIMYRSAEYKFILAEPAPAPAPAPASPAPPVKSDAAGRGGGGVNGPTQMLAIVMSVDRDE